MANNQKDLTKDHNQPEVTGTQQEKDPKKRNEQGQGKGVVSTTDTNTGNKEKKPDQKGTGLNEQSKITNQDTGITNKHDAGGENNQDKTALRDDEDVDEKGNTGEPGIEEPEIGTPVRNPEDTQRKIPKMTK